MRNASTIESILEFPFARLCKKKVAFRDVVDEVKAKLSGWKSQNLSQAGRSILIKSVLQAVPISISPNIRTM